MRTNKKTAAKRRQYRRKGGKKKCVVSTCVKKYVKQAIHRNVENKCIQYSQSFGFGGNNATYPTLSFRRLTPGALSYSISQGLGQADRIANKIRVMKATFRYILLPISYDLILNPTPKPQHVQLMFCNIKGNQRADPSATSVSVLFQNGNTSAGPTGLLGDILRPTNGDFWNIKRRVHHKIGYAIADGTGASGGSQYHANNDFAYNVMRTVDVTSMFPKVITYNEADVNPTTNSLYLLFQSVNADNTAQISDTAPCGITFWLDLIYEDA